MDKNTTNRVGLALDLMSRKGWGIERASKYAKTTRRTVKRYADKKGINLKTQVGKAIKVKRTPDDKIEDFLTLIHNGNSATKSARELRTTVRTMSKRTYKGVPIIEKSGNYWVCNFVPVKEYELVAYGELLSFDGKIQGRGVLSGPDANKSKNKRKQDEDYADIWYQLDIKKIYSTLPPEEIGKAYGKEIMDAAKKRFLGLNVNNASLSMKFKQNGAVLTHMTDRKRAGSNKVSVLENITKRYDMHFDKPIISIDEDFDYSKNVDFIPIGKYKDKEKKRADANFQLFYMRKNNLQGYGPIKMIIPYNLK